MGVLIDRAYLFASRRQNAASIEALCGFAMLQVTRNFDYFKSVELAVRATLEHPRFPLMKVDDEVLGRAKALLDAASLDERDTMYTISLARLRRECQGWDPMGDPACAALKSDGESYLMLRDALGAAALAWQAAGGPGDIITTAEEFNAAYNS